MRAVILYNERSGAGGVERATLERLLQEVQIEPTWLSLQYDYATCLGTCREIEPNRIIAVGGDGTVNTAARLAVTLGVPLAVIPTGTFNHFAKDVGIPLDMESAVRVAGSDTISLIDYASVNDEVFVNTSSIGAYPKAVRKKATIRHAVGKWLASVIAFFHTLRTLRNMHATLSFENKKIHVRTPSIFVGNNSYNFHDGNVTERARLDGGHLFVHVITTNRVGRLLVLGYKLVTGKKRTIDDIRLTVNELTVETREPVVAVSLDGEVIYLKTPLQFTIYPKQLSIVTP